MTEFKQIIQKEEIAEMPLATFKGEIIVVDNQNKLSEAINYLKSCNIIGFDTETKPSFTKGTSNSVALLQLSDSNKAYLFQLKKIGLPNELKEILSDSMIIKSGVAIKNDIKALNKLNKFIPSGFVELQGIVGKYGIEEKSLQKLSAIIMGIRISKSQRLSNWEADVLSLAQQQYAATDAWVGCEIFKKLQAVNLQL